jgi:FKBP-type peptidyl-prolyl cis-trans isomerase FkpA
MQLTATATMSTVIAALAFRSVGAFTAKLARHSTPFVVSSSSTARHMSSGPMPYDDDKMPLYALGTNLAMQVGGQGNFKTLLEDDELEIVLEAFCENLRGTNTQDPRAILTTYGPQLNKMLQERTEGIVERVKKDGAEFIDNFMDCTEEAVKTESGLVYYSMKEGEGNKPTLSNTVEVHYHGTLTDGTVFDSSVERGQTISFPLGGVIKGWQEGLALMKEGGKATLVIPSELAYGDGGSGDTIPPGATLKFEVELFKVQ